jgi:hypothetical protein
LSLELFDRFTFMDEAAMLLTNEHAGTNENIPLKFSVTKGVAIFGASTGTETEYRAVAEDRIAQ